MSRNTSGVLQQPCQVKLIPRHERRIPLREVVVEVDWPTGAFITLARSWTRLPDPPGVCLRWNRIAEMLEAVEHPHSDVFDTILVARHDAAAYFAVRAVLPLLVQLT